MKIALLILGAVLLLGFLEVFRPPDNTLIWESALDAGHVPLFGVIALIVLALVRMMSVRRGMTPYLIAFALTFLLAAGIEALQIVGPRDADVVDLARGTAGILSFLAVAMSLDRDLKIRGARRAALVAGALTLVAVGLASFAWMIRDYRQRAAAFPSICSFDASWETVFRGALRADLAVTDLPPPWSDGSGNRVGRITFLTAVYTGFHVSEVQPDWRGYRSLCFEVYSGLNGPVDLVLRVHDAYHDNRVSDRFNRALTVEPGRNAYRIGLEEIRRGPSDRDLDLSRVRGFALFAVRPDTVFQLYLDGFRLEGPVGP